MGRIASWMSCALIVGCQSPNPSTLTETVRARAIGDRIAVPRRLPAPLSAQLTPRARPRSHVMLGESQVERVVIRDSAIQVDVKSSRVRARVALPVIASDKFQLDDLDSGLF